MKEYNNSDNVTKYLLDKDYENKICVECKSPMPSFASINNGIIICGKCAEKHKQLGFNISYVRELKDKWDPYLLSFLERGGNSRFIRFSKKYELDSMPIEQKFNTKILEYYRLLLKSEILAEEPPKEISLEIAKQPIDNQKIIFPEFENYQIFEGKEKVEKKEGNLIQAFRYVGNGLGSLASFLGNKYQEYDINNKLKAGGSATLKGLTTAGNYLYDLSKPIANKAAQGMETLYNQMTGNNMNKEEISTIARENDEEKEEIIRLEEDNEVRDSNLMFKKPDDDKEENQNNLNEIKEDYPTFSKVNNVNGNENESNISAAPINLKNA